MKHSSRRLAVGIALSLSAALLATGCGGDSGGGGGSGSSGGGHFTVVKALEPVSLDPALVNAGVYGDAATGNAIFDQLFWIGEDGTTNYRLATDLSTDDGQAYTLKLREGVTFSDGKPFDAEAVKFSWERLLDPDLGSQQIGVAAEIKTITVVDATTLTFDLVAPNYSFPYRIDGTGALNWVVDPDAVKADPKGYGLKPIGAGPFVVDSWAAGAPVELVRNDDFWEEGKPLLDSVTIQSNPDSTVVADQVASGDAQLRTTGLKEGTDVVEESGGTIIDYTQPGGTLLTLNTARPPFDDVRARQALAYAMDRELYNETAYGGLETTTETLVPEDSPYYDASLAQVEDADKAQALFDELADEGKPVKFEYVSSPNSSAQGMGQLLTAVLGKYDNVEVTITNLDSTTVGPALFQGNFDASISGAFGLDMDLAFYQGFSEGGQLNFGKWSDAQATADLQEARTSDDPEVKKAAYLDFQKRVVDQVPAIVLVRSGAVISLAKGVSGVTVSAAGFPILTDATVD